MIVSTKPFWWSPPIWLQVQLCAPPGWYQWTERGLIYLGLTLTKIEAEATEVDR